MVHATIRRARPDEVDGAAQVWLRARKASVPEIPAPVHSDEAVQMWFESEVFPERELWVAVSGDTVVALLVLDDVSIDQLYVGPEHVGRGIGGRLLSIAKEQRPEGLKLWTFTANMSARQFYERHGFTTIGVATSDNEERAPAVRYEWMPDNDTAVSR